MAGYRVYFWFRYVPADRPGGPWWYQDFRGEAERGRFLNNLWPFLHAYALLAGHDLPWHDPMEIRPPAWAHIVEVKDAEDRV